MYFCASIVRDSVRLPFGLSEKPYLLQDIVLQVLGSCPPSLGQKVLFVVCHAGLCHGLAFIGCLAYYNSKIHLAWLLVGTVAAMWNSVKFYSKCIAKQHEA